MEEKKGQQCTLKEDWLAEVVHAVLKRITRSLSRLERIPTFRSRNFNRAPLHDILGVINMPQELKKFKFIKVGSLCVFQELLTLYLNLGSLWSMVEEHDQASTNLMIEIVKEIPPGPQMICDNVDIMSDILIYELVSKLMEVKTKELEEAHFGKRSPMRLLIDGDMSSDEEWEFWNN